MTAQTFRRRYGVGFAVVSLCLALGCSQAPGPSSSQPTRDSARQTVGQSLAARLWGAPKRTIVAAGDISAVRLAHQRATAKLVKKLAPTRVLTLGDEQYERGAYRDFASSYDRTWGQFKVRTMPTPGNHEYNTPGAAGYLRYFGAAATPHNRTYYSSNLAGWHLISLNSNIARGRTSAQVRWLRADLARATQDCVLAFWHSPLFSSGSRHGNDRSVATFWKVLRRAGADVILNGHEHNYERFAKQNSAGHVASDGIREFVVGTGGKGHYPFGTAQAHSLRRISKTFGVLQLALRRHGYRWRYVGVSGAVRDRGGPVRCN